jgi:hypothetical protein
MVARSPFKMSASRPRAGSEPGLTHSLAGSQDDFAFSKSFRDTRSFSKSSAGMT